MNIARGLFVPKGYPDSVAPEYAHYQLWDTVQQTTYFINTVISKRAIMVLSQPHCLLLIRKGQYTHLSSGRKCCQRICHTMRSFRTLSPTHKLSDQFASIEESCPASHLTGWPEIPRGGGCECDAAGSYSPGTRPRRACSIRVSVRAGASDDAPVQGERGALPDAFRDTERCGALYGDLGGTHLFITHIHSP